LPAPLRADQARWLRLLLQQELREPPLVQRSLAQVSRLLVAPMRIRVRVVQIQARIQVRLQVRILQDRPVHLRAFPEWVQAKFQRLCQVLVANCRRLRWIRK
jgi:hypothetical protein